MCKKSKRDNIFLPAVQRNLSDICDPWPSKTSILNLPSSMLSVLLLKLLNTYSHTHKVIRVASSPVMPKSIVFKVISEVLFQYDRTSEDYHRQEFVLPTGTNCLDCSNPSSRTSGSARYTALVFAVCNDNPSFRQPIEASLIHIIYVV